MGHFQREEYTERLWGWRECGSTERRSWLGTRVRGPPVVGMEAKEGGKGQLCRSLGLQAHSSEQWEASEECWHGRGKSLVGCSALLNEHRKDGRHKLGSTWQVSFYYPEDELGEVSCGRWNSTSECSQRTEKLVFQNWQPALN